MSDDGLITRSSPFPPAETIDRLSAMLTAKGLLVFARIDHGASAEENGLELRPTILLLFGHPRGGTPLMQDRQTAGIDLPLKALAWQDDKGQSWLTWIDPKWIARRHGLSHATAAVEAMAAGVDAIVKSLLG